MHMCHFSVPVISKLVVVLPFAAALLCIPTPGFATPILTADLASFAVLAATGVTNVPTSTIGGNLGSAVNPSVGGGYVFTSGSLQANTATAQQAQIDLDATMFPILTAFGVGLTIGSDLTGTILPGVYTVPAAATNLSGALILDGGTNPNPVWVFHFPGTLITSPTSTVTVIGSFLANAGLYWDVGSAATLDGLTFAGNVFARALISSDGNLDMSCGRLLSSDAQVTLIQDKISIGCLGAGFGSGGYDQGVDIGSGGGPGGEVPPIPEPATLTLLASGLVVAARSRWKRRRIGSGRP